MGSPRQQTILITGASRGIGLEFTRQWSEAGHAVFALARRPDEADGLQALQKQHAGTLRVAACDVADDASVETARERVARESDHLDLVINNAGAYGSRNSTLDSLDFDELRRVFEINTLGPLRISRSFRGLLKKGTRPRLVHISSLMGSIADNGSGGAWAYRVSKAALNMVNRNLERELEREGIVSVVLHPGWVRTRMGGDGAPLAVEESVAALVRTIDRLETDQSGGFFDREGKRLPW